MKFLTESGDWGTMWRAGHLLVTCTKTDLCKNYGNARFDGNSISVKYGQVTEGVFNSDKSMVAFFTNDLLQMFRAHCSPKINKDLVEAVVLSIATAYDFCLDLDMESYAGMTMSENMYVDSRRVEGRKKHYPELIPLL